MNHPVGTKAEMLRCNGINPLSGDYLLPVLSTDVVGAMARGERIDPDVIGQLRARHFAVSQASYGVMSGVDRTDISDAGWGVVFPSGAGPELRDALRPLLDHRRVHAAGRAARYREFAGPDGAQPGDASRDFLARHGSSPGQPANPDRVPYYLLLVGDPGAISYAFQYQLDVTYAVGRLCFETLDEYRRYAEAVVAAETPTSVASPRDVAFFGVRSPDDPSTHLSADHLISPLADRIRSRHPDRTVRALIGEGATKTNLHALLGGEDSPALIMAASHGLGFPAGHPLQRAHQGALLCQEWPGPRRWRRPIPPDFYFSGEDLARSESPPALMAFLFACYGGGTPDIDDFSLQARAPERIAPDPFVGRLPQRLLQEGVLAVVGHVDRAWSWSFMWPRVGEQLDVFESTLMMLLQGAPVGAALEHFNDRYAALSTELDIARDGVLAGKIPDDPMFSGLWTARNDARNFLLFGDPATRLPS